MIENIKRIWDLRIGWGLFIANWKLMKGQVSKAISLLNKLINKYPHNGPILAMMGMALIKNNEFQNGIYYLEESLKLIESDDRHFSEINAYLGYGYINMSLYDKAIDYYLAAINSWTETSIEFSKEDLYENLGLCYEEKNNFEYAIQAYNKGLGVNPKEISLYERLIRLYSAYGRYTEADRRLRQMLQIDPTLENDETVKQFMEIIEKNKGTTREKTPQNRELGKIYPFNKKKEEGKLH